MTAEVVVLIADLPDPKHGEVAVLDGTAEAERLVETCLQLGYSPERIRVFAGAEMEAQISERPKVDLLTKEPDQLAQDDDLSLGDEADLLETSRDEKAEIPHTLGEEEDEPAGTRSQDEIQPAHALSEARIAGWDNRSGASPAFSRLPEKPIELMPELPH